MLLPKERYGDSLSGRAPNNQLYNWSGGQFKLIKVKAIEMYKLNNILTKRILFEKDVSAWWMRNTEKPSLHFKFKFCCCVKSHLR